LADGGRYRPHFALAPRRSQESDFGRDARRLACQGEEPKLEGRPCLKRQHRPKPRFALRDAIIGLMDLVEGVGLGHHLHLALSPAALAYCRARWPSPPIPTTATVSFGWGSAQRRPL